MLLPQGGNQKVRFADAVHKHQLLTGASVGLLGKKLTEHCVHPIPTIPNPNPRTPPLPYGLQPHLGNCLRVPVCSYLLSLPRTLSSPPCGASITFSFHLLENSISDSCFLKQVRYLIMVIWLEPASGVSQFSRLEICQESQGRLASTQP